MNSWNGQIPAEEDPKEWITKNFPAYANYEFDP